MKEHQENHSIEIITESLAPVMPLSVIDHHGQRQDINIVGEQPLTIYLNRQEIVTVMTLGNHPAYLIAGFLLNQHLVNDISDIRSIHVDWSVNAASVYAQVSDANQAKLNRRVITSGCGQGTMLAAVIDSAATVAQQIPDRPLLNRKQLEQLLAQLATQNTIYRQAGGVHSCALCHEHGVIKMIEDVGRHNAIDALTGFLALTSLAERPTILYTTGRLTSEMVIKATQMRIPIVISRSGSTSMGVEIAQKANLTLIARAKGQRFLVLTGEHRLQLEPEH